MRCAIWYHLYNFKIPQRIKFKPITALLNVTKACGYGDEKNYEAPRTEK